MTEVLTAAQMRAIEQQAMAKGHATGLNLMERAGQGVVDAVMAQWPDLSQSPQRAVILCGPGNNGGDGFVIARLLADKGWNVAVFLWGDAGKLPPDAAENARRWQEIGDIAPMEEALGDGMRPDLLVDAMFGTGLSRPIPLICARAHRALRRRKGNARCRVVAVDCPSGFDADRGDFLLPEPPQDQGASGAFMQDEVGPRLLHADLCVTFHRAKVGLWLAEATISGRRPVVADIGLGDGPEIDDMAFQLANERNGSGLRLIAPGPETAASGLRVWLRHSAFDHIGRNGHKYQRGHVLVLGGGPGRGGAARMAARAALRIGAGLVTLGVPGDALTENAARLDAIMLRVIDDAATLTDALQDDRLSAVCLGPGLGVGARTRAMVLAALAATGMDAPPRRVVLDADALTSFADNPDDLFAALHEGAVLTPHEGEFARLFPDLATDRRQTMSKVDVARVGAKRAGCVLLLKGQATVIAAPDGQAALHAALYDRAVPWLGTAGAGDVLAGMIAGLLAPGTAAHGLRERVTAAAYLHTECARAFGPGLTAEDLVEQLPGVLRDLGL